MLQEGSPLNGSPRSLNTFKDVAAALREAEKRRVAGDLKRVEDSWIDPETEPVGVCAIGGIAIVSGMEVAITNALELIGTWPILNKSVPNPETGGTSRLLSAISDMCSTGMSWVDIADWLESLGEKTE